MSQMRKAVKSRAFAVPFDIYKLFVAGKREEAQSRVVLRIEWRRDE